jgi:hypothetical protein
MPACDRGDDKLVRSRDNIELDSRVCTTAGDAKRHTVELCGVTPISSHTSPGGLHANPIGGEKRASVESYLRRNTQTRFAVSG